MDENFRFETGREEPDIQTLQDFLIAWDFKSSREM
jgi:hypothetical protein